MREIAYLEPNKFSGWKILVRCLHIGVTISGTLILCLWLGMWLDRQLKTKMVFSFLFLLLGLVSCFKSLWDLTKE